MIFLNSASSAAALVFDLPLCTHTRTPRGNRERPESGIYFKIFEKTQYLMNTLYLINNMNVLVAVLVATAMETRPTVINIGVYEA